MHVRVCVCVCVCVCLFAEINLMTMTMTMMTMMMMITRRYRDGDWWYAEHVASGRRGYVPINHIAEVNSIRQFEYVGPVRRCVYVRPCALQTPR